MRIDEVSRETMLRAAHRLTARQHKRGVSLWSWVGSICCVGCTSAHQICRDYGWNPDERAEKELSYANTTVPADAKGAP
jgi:hypothetical protein